jgi:YVTN family beta-propeller protein
VTNRGSGTVSVMNTDTNKVTAIIRVGRAPALAAVNPLTGTIYLANFRLRDRVSNHSPEGMIMLLPSCQPSGDKHGAGA